MEQPKTEQIESPYLERIKNILVENPDTEIGKSETRTVERLPDLVNSLDAEAAFFSHLVDIFTYLEIPQWLQGQSARLNPEITELILELTGIFISNALEEPTQRGMITWFKDQTKRIKEFFKTDLGNYRYTLDQIPVLEKVEEVAGLKEPVCNAEAKNIQGAIGEKEQNGFWTQSEQEVNQLFQEYEQQRGYSGLEKYRLHPYMARPLSSETRQIWERDPERAKYWEFDIPWFLTRYAIKKGIPEDFRSIKNRIYDRLGWSDPTKEQTEFIQKCFAVYGVPKELFEKSYPEHYNK